MCVCVCMCARARVCVCVCVCVCIKQYDLPKRSYDIFTYKGNTSVFVAIKKSFLRNVSLKSCHEK